MMWGEKNLHKCWVLHKMNWISLNLNQRIEAHANLRIHNTSFNDICAITQAYKLLNHVIYNVKINT